MRAFVIGSASVGREDPNHKKQSDLLREAMLEIGRSLIIAGYDLVVCSPFPDSADHAAVEGASHAFDERSGPTIEFYTPNLEAIRLRLDEVRLALPRDRVKVFYQSISSGEDGTPEMTYTWLLAQLPALESADVVIALGGKTDGPSSLLLPIAEGKRKQILPFAFLGGAALRSFERHQYELTDRLGDQVAVLQDSKRVAEIPNLLNELIQSTAGRKSVGGIRFFLSYARTRPTEADFIEMILRRRGYPIYRDEEDFRPGTSINSEIRDHLYHASIFIALWCKEYACSPWCYDELDLALARRKDEKLEVWIFCLDDTRIVPPAARALTSFHTRTRTEIEKEILNQLSKHDVFQQ